MAVSDPARLAASPDALIEDLYRKTRRFPCPAISAHAPRGYTRVMLFGGRPPGGLNRRW